jgi:hypothetical protein
MSGAKEKKNIVPALVVSCGILLYLAPAAVALATDFTQRDDSCAASHQALDAYDSDRLAALSVDLMNDPSGGDCLLATYNMTRDGYVDVMAEVSKDRRLSDAYNDSFERLQN